MSGDVTDILIVRRLASVVCEIEFHADDLDIGRSYRITGTNLDVGRSDVIVDLLYMVTRWYDVGNIETKEEEEEEEERRAAAVGDVDEAVGERNLERIDLDLEFEQRIH